MTFSRKIRFKLLLFLVIFTLFSVFAQAETFVCADNQLYGDVQPYNFSLFTSTALQSGVLESGDAQVLAQIASGQHLPISLVDQYGFQSTCQCLDPNHDGSTTIFDSLLVEQVAKGLANVSAPTRCPIIPLPPLNATLCLPGSVLGDVDGNDNVSIIDARITAEIAAGIRVAPADLCCIDANPIGNPDGIVNVLDALAIAQNATGLISLIGPGCPLLPVPQANLSVTKTANMSTAVPGDLIEYTINVTNTGSADTFNISVVDYLPPFMTFINSTPNPTQIGVPSSSGQKVAWAINVLQGSSTIITVIVQIDPSYVPSLSGDLFTNTVKIGGSNHNQDSETITVFPVVIPNPQPILLVTKTDSADPVTAGSTLDYTITIENTGNDVAQNVQVIETYPAQVSYVISTPLRASTPPDTWDLGSINPGQIVTINITVLIDPLVANGTIITNTVDVFYDNSTSTIQTSAMETTTVLAAPTVPTALLFATKNANQTSVHPGEQLNYTISITNIGLADATNVVVTETYPAQTTFVSSVPNPDMGTTNQWTFPIIPVGQTELIFVTVDVSLLANGTLDNYVYIIYDNGVSNDSTNTTTSTSVNTTLPPPQFPIISIDKRANQTTVDAGDQLSYTITINNTGAAGVVTIRETYPAQTTFVSSVPNPDIGTTDTWTFMMSTGMVTTIDIIVDVDPLATGSLDNFVIASFTNATGLVNVSANVSTVVNPLPMVFPTNITLGKAANQSYVIAGDQLYYTIIIFNNDNVSGNIFLQEQYPNFTSYNSSSIPPNPGTDNEWNLTVLPGITLLDITLNTDVNATSGFFNEVFGTYFNGSSNVTVSANRNVPLANPINLTVTKTANVTSAMPGDLIMYTVNVTNPGFIPQNITITEQYPMGTTFVNATPMPTQGNDTWTTVVNGMRSYLIDITLQVDANATGPLVNTVLVNGSQNITTNNTINVTQPPVIGVPNLTITKTDSPDPVFTGEVLNYTLTITNVGNGTAIGVQVTEMYPNEVTFLSANPMPMPPPFVDEWQLGNILPGEVRTINISVLVDSGLANGTIITNGAFIEYSDGIIQYIVPVSEDTLVLNPPTVPTLEITKVANQTSVMADDQIEYTITIRNIARVDATNVVIQETYPVQTSFNSSVPTPDLGTDNQWTFPIIPAFSTQNITIVLDVFRNATGSLFNMVNATVNNGTTNVTTNSTTNTTIVPIPRAFLTIDKADTPDPVMTGGVLNYTITIQNIGNATATSVVVAETFPAEFTFVSSSPSRVPFTFTWPLFNILPGEIRTINITGVVDTGLINGTVLTNDVSVFYDDNVIYTFNYDRENTTIDSTILPPPVPQQIVLNKTANQTLVVPGDLVLYTITF